ncbi:MAG TPA: YciI-like protein [Vicinamibacteria bacterium]|nr:YciI-like protein [Vicinamibacteria bacterium]
MYYLLFYDYVDDVVDRRAPLREEHLGLAREAHQRGDLLYGGALADPVDQAVLVFKVEDPSKIEDFVASDPYVSGGLVKQWRIRKWNVVIGAEGN